MELVLFTPEILGSRELALLPALADSGIARLHARWPGASEDQARGWLDIMPAALRARTVVHQHHRLAIEYGLLGVHVKDAPAVQEAGSVARALPCPAPAPRGFRSRACHEAAQLIEHCGTYDCLIAAPVFEAISKPGHLPRVNNWRLDEFRSQRATRGPRLTHACALGGITKDRLRDCASLGFDQAAVLGVVWTAEQPRTVIEALTKEAGLLK